MPVLLFLLLLAGAPVASQTPPRNAAGASGAPVAATASAPEDVAPASTGAMLRLERAEAARASDAGTAAQPTVQGFLYHVFLTAVTALVTALIWRAVF